MSKKIYVGNLSYSTTAETLSSLFSQFGEVTSSNIIMDRETNRSKGFGFVEMADDAAADKAIEALGGKEVDGRRVRVSQAEEKQRGPRPGHSRSFNNRERNFDRSDRY